MLEASEQSPQSTLIGRRANGDLADEPGGGFQPRRTQLNPNGSLVNKKAPADGQPGQVAFGE
jgi:hypothetical protein